MFRLWAIAVFLFAAASSQALTLQWLSKFGPSVPVGVSFKKIVDTGSGYVVAGNVMHPYVSIIRTDYNGNVLASNLFEPLALLGAYVTDLQVDDSGRVYLLAGGSEDGLSVYAGVACLDKNTLVTVWQQIVQPKPNIQDSFRGVTMAVRKGVGIERILLAYSTGVVGTQDDSFQFKCWNASGVEVFAGSEQHGQGHYSLDSVAFPTAGAGFAIGGAVNDQAFALRLSDTGTVTWATNSVNVGSSIRALELNGSELLGAGGFVDNGVRPAAYEFGPAGEHVVSYDVLRDGAATMMSKQKDKEFILLSPAGGSYHLHRFNLTSHTLVYISSYAHANPTFVVATSGNRAFVNGGSGMQHINLANATTVANVTQPWRTFGAVANHAQGVFAVGGRPDTLHGFVSGFDTAYRGLTQFYVSGYVARTPVKSVEDATGARYISSTANDLAMRGSTVIVKFSPAGAVVWNRTLSVSGDSGILPIDMAYSAAENAIYAVGMTFDTIVLSKLNASTGAVLFTKKTISPGNNLRPQVAVLGADGRLWVAGSLFTSAGLSREFLYRYDSAGVLLSMNVMVPQTPTAKSTILYQLSANRWAIVKGDTVSGVGARISYFNNAGSNTSNYDFDPTDTVSGIASAKAVNGDLLVAVMRTASTELRRFSATTGDSNMTATLPLYRALGFMMTGSANGSIYFAAQRDSDFLFEIRAVSGSGAPLWSSTFDHTFYGAADITTDANNWVYVVGTEQPLDNWPNTYLVRYLANGVRSAQRRLAGYPLDVSYSAAGGVQVVGELPVRNKMKQIYVARYSSP